MVRPPESSDDNQHEPRRKTYNLTKTLIRKLTEPKLYYDSNTQNFGVKVARSGRKTYFVKYKVKGARNWRVAKICGCDAKSLDEARAAALRIIGLAADRKDYLEEIANQRSIPTLSEWVSEYLEGVRKRKKNPKPDERFLTFACRTLGSIQLNNIKPPDVRNLMRKISDEGKKPTNGNRFLASIRKCLKDAVRAGYMVGNPAEFLAPYRENPPRQERLSDEEWPRFLRAVDHLADPHLRLAFRFLALTGARVSEVLRARWEDIDFAAQLWRLPSTKAGKPQTIPLTPELLQDLIDCPRVGPFLIPGRDPQKRRNDYLKKPWARLKETADLRPDIHIHDIRRTVGYYISKESGLHIAQRVLRHSDVRTTGDIYAPLGIDDLRPALEGLGQYPTNGKEEQPVN